MEVIPPLDMGGVIWGGAKKLWGLVTDPAGTIQDSILQHIGEAMGAAAKKTVDMSLSMWTSIPSFTFSGLNKLNPYLHIWMALALLVGVSVALVKLAWTMRGEHVKVVFAVFFNVVVASAMTGVMTDLATSLGDRWVSYLFASDIGKQSAKNSVAWGKMIVNMSLSNGGIVLPAKQVLPVFFSVMMFLLLMVGGFAQGLFMLFRNSMLPVMIVLAPLAVAASATRSGQRWSTRVYAWLLAFVMYKPISATIYAVGMLAIFSDEKDPARAQWAILEGTILFVATALALPALVKLFAPIASAGTSSAFSGGAVAGAAVGAAAVGAAVVSGVGAPAAVGGGAAAAGGAAGGSGAGSGGPSGGSVASGTDESVTSRTGGSSSGGGVSVSADGDSVGVVSAGVSNVGGLGVSRSGSGGSSGGSVVSGSGGSAGFGASGSASGVSGAASGVSGAGVVAGGSGAGRQTWRDIRDAAYGAQMVGGVARSAGGVVDDVAVDTEAGATGSDRVL